MPRWPEREPLGDANDPRSFEVLIARYLEWRDVHHYSPRARGTCESCLRGFASWCVERGLERPVDVTRAVVERYQRWLFHHRREDTGRALAVRTQISRLSYLRSFFKYLARERYVLYDPAAAIELPREPMRLPVDGFTLDEVEQVLAVPDVNDPVGLRNRAILEVLYSTGIRRMEVANLSLWDVDMDGGTVTVRGGKGGHDRVVPIGERALAWLRRYLDTARGQLVLHPDEWALFISNRGSRFSSGGLGNEVTKIIKRSGVRERLGSCHLFRHTMATMMLDNGADVRYVQEMLGHARLTTTQIYTKVSIEKLKEIHAATHPSGRLGRRDEDEEALP